MRPLPILGLLATACLRAQTPAPAFDAASIKLVKGPITYSADPTIHGRRVVSTASSLRDLVQYAYNLRWDAVEGLPPWAADAHYDLDAVSEGEGILQPGQCRPMMRALLADRFQLTTHFETQELPAFALVVEKSGPKFHQAPADATGGYSVQVGEKGNHMEVKRGTMEQLARQLSVTAGRPVVDRTGLSATYAYTLDWMPPQRSLTSDIDTPDLFTALRAQLGLRLEATRAPLEKLVIDRAEKPSGN